jgi:hypothetical protein
LFLAHELAEKNMKRGRSGGAVAGGWLGLPEVISTWGF